MKLNGEVNQKGRFSEKLKKRRKFPETLSKWSVQLFCIGLLLSCVLFSGCGGNREKAADTSPQAADSSTDSAESLVPKKEDSSEENSDGQKQDASSQENLEEQSQKDDASSQERQEEIQKYSSTGFAMDTVISETIYTSGEDCTAGIQELLAQIEQQWISWTDEKSEIYQLNSSGSGEVSPVLSSYLAQVLALSDKSKGAFDPTLGEVIRLWDIGGENPKVPDASELAGLLESCGPEKVSLAGQTVTLSQGARLDLGAVGKGIGCDEIASFLQADDKVSGAIVNLGGSSVMSYGEKPDGSLWQVAITDPRDTEGDYLGAVTLRGTEFLSTSGDYEKYFMEDGVRYHHILDPATGCPVQNGLTSVTVVASNGLDADGLSTACFVLGREKGFQLLEEYDADGLFVDEEGRVFLTEGMKERFRLMKEEAYTVAR